MSVPALALAPVLIDTGTGASPRPLNTQLLDRATRPDYHQWLAGTAAANGCTRPVRLHGTIRDLDPATGEVLRTLDTETLPDGCCTSRAGTAAPRSARPAPRPTGPTPTSSSKPGWPEAKASPSRSARIRACSPRSPRPRSARSIPGA